MVKYILYYLLCNNLDVFGGRLMKLLEDRILHDGVIKKGNILKVDSFLNHQIDVPLIQELGKELKRLYADAPINKILTIEASGIGIACVVATYFQVPVVFAKKTSGSNMDSDVYFTQVYSFTHSKMNNVVVSKRFLGPDDHVLIIDDFLANGAAMEGLIDIVRQAGAKVEGLGIAIEKGYQGGGDKLRDKGIRVESLAIIEKMDPAAHSVEFRH